MGQCLTDEALNRCVCAYAEATLLCVQHGNVAWLTDQAGLDLGMLHQIIHGNSDVRVADQVNTRYAHGGGWRPIEGFSIQFDGDKPELLYPGDRPLQNLALLPVASGELVMLFEYSWVAVIDLKTGRFEVSRMD